VGSTFFSLGDKPETGRVALLLISTVLFIIVLPFSRALPILFVATQITVIAAAVLVAAVMRRTRWVAAILGLATVVLNILIQYDSSTEFVLVYLTVNALLFAYVAALMLIRIFIAPKIGWEHMFLAVATYMLVGLIWAYAFIGLETVQPGSFSFTARAGADPSWTELYYLSFVTLTTLGYGDVTPVTQPARSLAILESITGVLFLAILVGGLGNFIATKKDR
jgi:hypothetical protein